MKYKTVATVHNGFTSKFGIPKQSGIAEDIESTIIFEPEYRNPDAIRGLDGFSHIWLIWDFSQSGESDSLTVRPPRLGGNRRMGVFATRSPFRPNPVGLSCVKIKNIDYECADAPVITVTGADLMNGTPVIDIKPYLPKFDCIADARGGFSDEVEIDPLNVVIPEKFKNSCSGSFIRDISRILSGDPRPQYHDDPDRIYGFEFDGRNIRFKVSGKTAQVTDIQEESSCSDK